MSQAEVTAGFQDLKKVKLKEQREQGDSGEVSKGKTSGFGVMFKPVSSVLRAKRNLQSSVGGGSEGEKEVRISW